MAIIHDDDLDQPGRETAFGHIPAVETVNVRNVATRAIYLVAIAIAMAGWLWLIAWVAVQLV